MSHIFDAESAESNSTCSISLGVVDLMTVSDSPSKVSSSGTAMTEDDNNVKEGCYEAMRRKFTKSGMYIHLINCVSPGQHPCIRL